MAQRLEGNLHVDGTLSAKTLKPSDGSVTNASVASNAAIDAAKMDHRHRAHHAQANSAAADETRMLFCARAAGSVVSFRAGSIAAATGNATCTIDLKKNGASILQDVITLDENSTNREAVDATITEDDYVAGDLFEVVIDGTIGSGALPTGVFCDAEFDEAAAA